MNKLIVLIAILIACGTMLFLYLDEDNINLPSVVNEQEKQLSDKSPIPSPPPSIKPSPIPKKTGTPAPPGFSDKLSPSTATVATPEKKSVNIEEKTELDPVVEEDESINSYPIEDAEIYFVPPDQRYPGNLGGPPPLDIPDSR